MRNEYLRLDKIEGPFVVLSEVSDAAYDEIVELHADNGQSRRKGRVVLLDEDRAVVQVFGSTTGLSSINTSVRFTGKPLTIPLSKEILGRTFNGIGEAIDGGGDVYSSVRGI